MLAQHLVRKLVPDLLRVWVACRQMEQHQHLDQNGCQHKQLQRPQHQKPQTLQQPTQRLLAQQQAPWCLLRHLLRLRLPVPVPEAVLVLKQIPVLVWLRVQVRVLVRVRVQVRVRVRVRVVVRRIEQ